MATALHASPNRPGGIAPLWRLASEPELPAAGAAYDFGTRIFLAMPHEQKSRLPVEPGVRQEHQFGGQHSKDGNAMALVRFEPSFRRYFPENQPVRIGFDPDGPWQMVPYKGERFLHLHVAGVKSWSVESVNPFIATVSAVEQEGGVDQNQYNVCRLRGLHQGRTSLIARGPKREELAKIEIEVKHRLKRFIRFFLVSDKAGHKTTFTEDDTKAWTKFINEEVFGPQINVEFQYLMTGRITIPEDLGERIDFSSIGDMPYVRRDGEAGRIWHMITDSSMRQAEVFNVFCVWDFVSQNEDGKDLAAFVASKSRVTVDEMQKSGVNYNMCMLKENTAYPLYKQVLAHEAGHFLNRYPGHVEGEEELMAPGSGGLVLRKAEAKRMNPSPG